MTSVYERKHRAKVEMREKLLPEMDPSTLEEDDIVVADSLWWVGEGVTFIVRRVYKNGNVSLQNERGERLKILADGSVLGSPKAYWMKGDRFDYDY